jgi:hypothetical protein
MSETPPTRDELASAWLDGELSPADAAAVETDADLRARAEELRAAIAVVAATVDPLPAARLDEIVERAVAAAPAATGPSAATPEPPRAGVVDLAARRRPPAAWLAAAAAVVAILLAVGALSLAGGDDGGRSDTAASGAEDTAQLRSEAAESDASDAGGAASATTAAAAADAESAAEEAGPPDLGVIKDEVELRVALATAFATVDTTPAAPPADTDEEGGTEPSAPPDGVCADAARASGQPVSTARLVWRGTAAEVTVVRPPSSSSAQIAVVTDVASCDVLATVEVEG